LTAAAAEAADLSTPAAELRAERLLSDNLAWLRDYAGRRINSRLMDERRSIAPHVVLDFGNRGLLGMQVPLACGGRLALPTRHSLRLTRALAAADLTLASFVGVNNILGVGPILRFAGEAIKARYLPELAAGRVLASFAYTEPVAGSNPLDIAATGRAAPQGGFVLDGTKVWSGSAAWAGLINVFVNRIDRDGQLGGHLAFCVPTDTPGLRQGPEALTMGVRGMVQNSVHLEQVRIGADHLLGTVGGGLAVANEAMQTARLWVASAAVGGMRRALQLAGRYARRRRIGSALLIDSDLVRARLASSLWAAQALECLVERMAADIDAGLVLPPETYAIAKALGGEWLHEASDGAIQTLGGRGYIETNHLSQLARDARVLRIFEGPTDTMLMYVGRRCLEGGAAFFDYLERRLGAGDTAAQLRAALEAVRERRCRLAAPVDCIGDALAGQLAALHLVRACLLACGTEALLVLGWLDGRIAQLKAALPGERTAPARQAVEALLDAVESALGELEQRAPDEDRRLDPYLAKDFA
jgi:alkylation response protein AidB-like acyl-CoA dehydrogenase